MIRTTDRYTSASMAHWQHFRASALIGNRTRDLGTFPRLDLSPLRSHLERRLYYQDHRLFESLRGRRHDRPHKRTTPCYWYGNLGAQVIKKFILATAVILAFLGLGCEFKRLPIVSVAVSFVPPALSVLGVVANIETTSTWPTETQCLAV